MAHDMQWPIDGLVGIMAYDWTSLAQIVGEHNMVPFMVF